MEWSAADFGVDDEEEEERPSRKRKAEDVLSRISKAPRQTVAKLNRKVSRLKKDLEVKFKDASLHGSPTNLVPLTIIFNTLAQGDGPSHRTGSKITAIGFQARFAIHSNLITNFGPLQTSTFRVMIVQDRHNGLGTALVPYSVTDDKAVLFDPTSKLDPTILMYNAYQRNRYNILYDEVFDIDINTLQQWSNLTPGLGSSNSAENPVQVRRTKTVHIRRRIVVQYNTGGAGTVGEIQTNAIWLVVYNSLGSAANNHCDAWIRMYYLDG